MGKVKLFVVKTLAALLLAGVVFLSILALGCGSDGVVDSRPGHEAPVVKTLPLIHLELTDKLTGDVYPIECLSFEINDDIMTIYLELTTQEIAGISGYIIHVGGGAAPPLNSGNHTLEKRGQNN